jgi:predicted DNA-binding transcriptional regulator AlpA
MERILILKEFAERVGITPEWLSKLIKQGKVVPRIRGVNQRYFLESDVKDWIEGNESPLFVRDLPKKG